MEFQGRLSLVLNKSQEEIEALSSPEFSYWIAYDKAFGLPDPWLQTGIICATIASVMSGKDYKPTDFMPVKPKVRIKTAQENRLALETFKALQRKQ